MRSRLIVLTTLIVVLLPACAPVTPAPGGSAATGRLAITGAWVRAAGQMSGMNSAAYVLIQNKGGEADRLLSAQTDAAKAVELHTVEMQDDVMKMHQVPAIDVPANGQAELKPGGFHIMLIGITRDLNVGDKVTLTLNFEKAGAVTVEAEVRAP